MHLRKQLHFWTYKSWKCARNFLHKPRKAKTSKICLNFTAISFIFGRTNRKIGPELFYKLASGEFLNCVWTFFHRSLLYIHAVTWERLESWKYVPHIFEKITKFCFVKFSLVEEMSPNLQVPIFKIFVCWRPKKVPKVLAFFSLEGTLTVDIATRNPPISESVKKDATKYWATARGCPVRFLSQP